MNAVGRCLGDKATYPTSTLEYFRLLMIVCHEYSQDRAMRNCLLMRDAAQLAEMYKKSTAPHCNLNRPRPLTAKVCPTFYDSFFFDR